MELSCHSLIIHITQAFIAFGSCSDVEQQKCGHWGTNDFTKVIWAKEPEGHGFQNIKDSQDSKTGRVRLNDYRK